MMATIGGKPFANAGSISKPIGKVSGTPAKPKVTAPKPVAPAKQLPEFPTQINKPKPTIPTGPRIPGPNLPKPSGPGISWGNPTIRPPMGSTPRPPTSAPRPPTSRPPSYGAPPTTYRPPTSGYPRPSMPRSPSIPSAGPRMPGLPSGAGPQLPQAPSAGAGGGQQQPTQDLGGLASMMALMVPAQQSQAVYVGGGDSGQPLPGQADRSFKGRDPGVREMGSGNYLDLLQQGWG